eukprot:5516061-Prymnesium_polylepis.1
MDHMFGTHYFFHSTCHGMSRPARAQDGTALGRIPVITHKKVKLLEEVSDWPWARHLRCVRSSHCRSRSINRVWNRTNSSEQSVFANGCASDDLATCVSLSGFTR